MSMLRLILNDADAFQSQYLPELVMAGESDEKSLSTRSPTYGPSTSAYTCLVVAAARTNALCRGRRNAQAPALMTVENSDVLFTISESVNV